MRMSNFGWSMHFSWYFAVEDGEVDVDLDDAEAGLDGAAEGKHALLGSVEEPIFASRPGQHALGVGGHIASKSLSFKAWERM